MSDLRYMLDTNICIYATQGTSEALKDRLACQRSGSLAVSAITLAELAIGLDGEVTEHAGMSAFLAAAPPLPFDSDAAQAYGRLPFRRGSYDRLIAAHALSLGLVLVSNDAAGFADVPGLAVENWTTP